MMAHVDAWEAWSCLPTCRSQHPQCPTHLRHFHRKRSPPLTPTQNTTSGASHWGHQHSDPTPTHLTLTRTLITDSTLCVHSANSHLFFSDISNYPTDQQINKEQNNYVTMEQWNKGTMEQWNNLFFFCILWFFSFSVEAESKLLPFWQSIYLICVGSPHDITHIYTTMGTAYLPLEYS